MPDGPFWTEWYKDAEARYGVTLEEMELRTRELHGPEATPHGDGLYPIDMTKYVPPPDADAKLADWEAAKAAQAAINPKRELPPAYTPATSKPQSQPSERGKYPEGTRHYEGNVAYLQPAGAAVSQPITTFAEPRPESSVDRGVIAATNRYMEELATFTTERQKVDTDPHLSEAGKIRAYEKLAELLPDTKGAARDVTSQSVHAAKALKGVHLAGEGFDYGAALAFAAQFAALPLESKEAVYRHARATGDQQFLGTFEVLPAPLLGVLDITRDRWLGEAIEAVHGETLEEARADAETINAARSILRAGQKILEEMGLARFDLELLELTQPFDLAANLAPQIAAGLEALEQAEASAASTEAAEEPEAEPVEDELQR